MSNALDFNILKSNERGLTENDWLKSYHSFSFGGYHNLQRLNFGTLRVFNDDVIAPGKGFGTHSHDNMEIITIVLEGAVKHKDSTGQQGIIRANEVQRMSAGSGIRHSEFNASPDEKLRLLQIWVYPNKRDMTPSYEQKSFSPELLKNTLYPIVARVPSDETITIHQDATFYLGHFDKGRVISHKLSSKTHGDYLFIIEGEVSLDGNTLKEGDSAQVISTDQLKVKALTPAKVLLIEVDVNTL